MSYRKKVNVDKVSNRLKVEKVWGPDGVVPGRRRTYTHIQSEPSNTWLVVHNLGSTQVLAEIFTEDWEELDAYYRIIDENSLVVEVNPPLKGYVVVYE